MAKLICFIGLLFLIVLSSIVPRTEAGGGDDKGGSVIILGMPSGHGGYGHGHGGGGYPNIISGGGKKDGDTIIIGPNWLVLIMIKTNFPSFFFYSFNPKMLPSLALSYASYPLERFLYPIYVCANMLGSNEL